jgi:hypothetical protein
MNFPLKAILLLNSALCCVVHANDVLDALEGKKKSSEIQVAAAPAGPGRDANGALTYPETTYPPSRLDAVWSKAVVYENEANPWVQRMAITAFFDQQAAFGSAEVDGVGIVPEKSVDLDGTRSRRTRLGARIRAFRNTDIEANYEFSGSDDQRGIERLKVRTEFMPDAAVTFGKFRPDFGTEYSTEPENYLYPDRSMLSNMIAPDQTLGIRVDFKRKDWDFGLGWFSGDANPYFPGIEGEGSLLFNMKRTLVEGSGSSLSRVVWHFDYLHNFDGARSGTTPRFSVAGRRSANGNQLVATNPLFHDLVSTGIVLDRGRFSFMGDFMIAKGQGAAYGLTLAPSYWAIPGRLNIIGRYHYAVSDDAGGLISTMGTSSDPAFDSSPFFIGDEYTSFYLGANYHLYRDQLILMGGLERAVLGDEQGADFNTEAWIWHAGARMSF